MSGQSWALCAMVVAVLVFLAWITGRTSRTENLAELIRAVRGQRRPNRPTAAGGPTSGAGSDVGDTSVGRPATASRGAGEDGA